MAEVEQAIAVVVAGGVAIIPTDTVYGLVARGDSEEAARRLYAVKGRAEQQPTAVLFASVESLAENLPGLADDALAAARLLLPGPFTLVLPNASGRFAWLAGGRPDTIGVRVPALPPGGTRVLAAVGCLVATSANLPGGTEARSLGDITPELLARVDAVVDGGQLAGIPSTVLDLTGSEPRVLREGAVPAAEALARLGV